MIKKTILLAVVVATGLSAMAEGRALPSPDKSAGLPVMEAFSHRKSVLTSNKEYKVRFEIILCSKKRLTKKYPQLLDEQLRFAQSDTANIEFAK